jgi:ankyrin repeat protein
MENGQTELHRAALAGEAELCRQLSAAQANVADGHGKTPLVLALERGNERAAEVLVEHTDPAVTTGFGRTALHVAAARGVSAQLARRLLERGVARDAVDDKGK